MKIQFDRESQRNVIQTVKRVIRGRTAAYVFWHWGWIANGPYWYVFSIGAVSFAWHNELGTWVWHVTLNLD